MDSSRPFTIDIPESELVRLKQKLDQARLPKRRFHGWEHGTDISYMQDLLDYWTTGYDWRAREQLLNAANHRMVEIEGCTLHYIHQKSSASSAIPLLLMQGWPSSFIQMLDIMELLTADTGDNTVTFDVVALSLPGYAFTEFPDQQSLDFESVADLAVKLMVQLGYDRFAARGSDQGALVQQQIGLKYPDRLIGIHRSGITPFIHPLPGDLTREEQEYQSRVKAWAENETSYAQLQALRPETLIPALCDSPVGLASWIIEKFQRWGDCGDDPAKVFGRDRLLDNIMLHWFSDGGADAIRLYHGARTNPGRTGRVVVPTAISMPLHDGISLPAPRSWAERLYNVTRFTVLERGGHFPEWEVPHILAADIRQFFQTLPR